MEYKEKASDGVLYQVLNLLILDEDDIREIPTHSHGRHVQAELSGLKYLDAFPVVETLILTGGIPTEEGFVALYRHKELKRLVLDYEETDSDEEGIDLTQFPALEYVLSRSNLNIKNHSLQWPGIKTEICNYYRNGEPIKTGLPDSINLLPKRSFLTTSCEGSGGAPGLIGNILFAMNEVFTDRHFGEQFSEKIDSIKICPICLGGEFEGIMPERRYISWKKRKADVRLVIPYAEFVTAGAQKRLEMVKKNITDSAEYVRRRDKTFDAHRFLEAVWDAFED